MKGITLYSLDLRKKEFQIKGVWRFTFPSCGTQLEKKGLSDIVAELKINVKNRNLYKTSKSS